MKEMINYYYNLFPQKILYRKDYIEFVSTSNYYYLMPEKNKLKDAIVIDRILKFNQINIYDFVLNKNQQYISVINNKKYVLLKLLVERSNDEIDFNDLILFSKIKLNYNSYISWKKRWIKKNDVLEKCSVNLISKNDELNKLLNYFIEVSENAIMYSNYHIVEYKNQYNVSLQHERLSSKTKKRLIFYNPFFIILDNQTRDVSELIKDLAFAEKNYEKLIEDVIKKMNLNYTDLKLLIARIMFPTYFFDYLENKNSNNKKIITYASYYINIVNQIVKTINKYSEVPIPYHH